MNNLFQDLRYAIRMLLKKPGFTAVAVLTLALGIGANTTIFSVINAVLIRPLPFEEADRLAVIARGIRSDSLMTSSYTELTGWKEQSQVFEEVAASTRQDYDLAGGDQPERVSGLSVSSGFFELLGVTPAQGRPFTDEEHEEGQSRVAIISHELWQRRFGSDKEIIDRTLLLDANNYTVIGVMPPDFQYILQRPAQDFDIIVPQIPDPERSGRYLLVVGRLKPGATHGQAQAEMEVISDRIDRESPNQDEKMGTYVIPAHEHLIGGYRRTLFMLFGAVAIVLLIACTNVANLLLARAAARQKEMAVRASLGATRWRLVRQLLTESMLLALLGGGAGILTAFWGIDFLVGILPDWFPRAQEVNLDMRVLGFTTAISILSGAIFGLVPAFAASRPDLNEALKEGGGGFAGGIGRNRIRALLVIAEVALTFVLLVGAGLLVRTLMHLQSIDPGFEAENVLTVQMTLPEAKFTSAQQVRGFYRQITERIEALPGVESVGLVNILPLTGRVAITRLTPEAPASSSGLSVSASNVSEGYFRSMGITLLKGRFFTEGDDQNAARAAIVNQRLANKLWPGDESLGKRVRLGGQDAPWIEIVGVVADAKNANLLSDHRSEIYFPYLQRASRSMYLTVRSAAEPEGLVAALRNEVLAVDRDQPVYNIRTMEERLSDSIAFGRFPMLLLSVFAALALALAVAGIYGVVSYMTAQRTHEIGIRIALGAQSRDVLRLIVGQGLFMALAGVGLGLATSLALTRYISSLLHGVSATDPATFLVVSLILTGVALAACAVPARRASGIDPAVALRYE
ncbi:MAG: ABC transporter permease [Blastocatellia bacterium]|nr:ABC transporter permease [Blastocatellia bacterium]